MTVRTTRTTVTFRHAALLEGVGEVLPAGTYDVDVDEEAIEQRDRTAFVRVATYLYVPTGSGKRMCTVDAEELERLAGVAD